MNLLRSFGLAFILIAYQVAKVVSLEISDKGPNEGIYGAALIPMREDLSCDEEILFKHCLTMLSKGCQGVVLFGTTGEGSSFSLKEKESTIRYLVERGLDPKKMIVCNASSCVEDTVQLMKMSLDLGIAYFLLAPPSYFIPISDDGVVAFYKAILHQVKDPKLRVLLYHIPQFTGVPITLPVIKKLLDEFPDTIAGLKESEGNLAFTKAIIDTFPHFKVFVGSEKQIIEAVSYGAAGAICGLPNLYPELMCSLFERGKTHDANKTSKELSSFFEAKQDLFFIAAFKAVMKHRHGAIWQHIRPPLLALNQSQEQAFIQKLINMNLENSAIEASVGFTN